MSEVEVEPPRARSQAIDALRGAAIISMFAANLAAPCLAPPHPLWLRIYGSFAAPTFIFLAGMMTSLGNRHAPLANLLKRTLLLLGLGAGIDLLCWGIVPFESFDVLYLLGLALPVVGLTARLALGQQALLAALVLLLTPWLRERIGYGPLLADDLAYPWPIWRRALVDGWFPIFPWLGVALLGGALGRVDPLRPQRRRWLVPAGVLLTLVGGVGWFFAPPELVTRMGYSELFYPPSSQYLALALGALLLVLRGLDGLGRRHSLAWLVLLGRSSLLLYVSHVALIALVLDEGFERQPLHDYLALYAAMTGSLALLAWLVQKTERWFKTARERRATTERA